MTDLDRVLRRVADDPAFAARLSADPRAALADYALSDAEFTELEHRVVLPASASPSTPVGVGAFFTPPPPPRTRWPRLVVAGAVGALVLVGSGAGYGLAASRDPGPPGSSADPASVALTPVAYSLCPGAAARATEQGAFHRGDRVWVVGKDGSGRWLQVRGPSGGSVWISAATVSLTGGEHLPIVPCELPDDSAGTAPAAPAPSGADPAGSELADPAVDGPGGSASVPAPTTPGGPPPTDANGVEVSDPAPGPSVTVPPGSPTPAGGSADRDGPAIAGLGAGPADIWQHAAGAGGRCVTQTTSSVAAVITDPSGVTGAALEWSFAGTPGQHGTNGMAPSGDSWSATVGPIEWIADAIPAGGTDVTVTIRAVDGAGNTSTASTVVHLHNAQECLG